MRLLKTAALCGAALLSGCAKDPVAPLFEGELIALNGQWTAGSMLHVKLRSTDEDPATPESYAIYSVGCVDTGFVDKADGKFWSGVAPAKNPDLAEHLRQARHDGHCPVEDAARYVELMRLTTEGVSIALTPDRRFATLTHSSGGSARFEVYLGNILE